MRWPKLKTPRAIQDFLDAVAYNIEDRAKCPREVVLERRAHCFGGALFGAAALERIGHPPLLVDLRAQDDDDHVLAVFRRFGCWGAVAKSNFVGLRFREPIHRTLRELAVSYFEGYYALDRRKSLREYSATVDLRRFDALNWRADPAAQDAIADALDAQRHYPILARSMRRALSPVDDRTYHGGMVGTDLAGAYDPRKKR